MAVFKCKMCGGGLNITEGMTVCECEYCGSVQTVPQLDDEKKINLFSRANRLRSAGEFDKASGVYETLVSDYPEEAEAYWGLLLCKFGIEYVDDPGTGKKVPTCHRSSFDSIMEDEDFEMVMECSDPASRAVYREEAKAIESLRIRINEVSSKEDPYDIFICYKETDDSGNRTIDSVIAQDVYQALVQKGYKVFFSRITLEDKLGQEYEPYIFAALNSAKIMLAFGTDYEYYNAVWVKNEWSRFLSLIEKGANKTLIPCYKGIDAYDMPKEFARLQAQDMGKVGAMQDLLRGIEKILGAKNKNTVTAPVPSALREGDLTRMGLLRRTFMFIEDGDWSNADRYAEKILDIDPENGEAYLAKAMADLRIPNLVTLTNVTYFENNPNTQKALRYGSDALRNDILGFIESHKSAERMRQKAEEERKKREEQAAQETAEKVIATFMAKGQSSDTPKQKLSFGQAVNALLSNPRVIQIVCEKNLKQVSLYNGYVTIPFGRYPQLSKGATSDIEWLVLRKDGHRVLLISKDALECLKYSENGTLATWETCSLRRWLNETFITSAFTAEEKNMILNVSVAADKTHTLGTGPVNDTIDKIFLLDGAEVNLYLNTRSARTCQETEYCRARGSSTPGRWWLRTPGAYVSGDGTVNYGGRSVFASNSAVRPTLWIDLES